MTVKAKQIPGWFKLADYAGAANFNLSDWVVMLSHRHLWRQSLDTTYPEGVPEEQKANFWDGYLGDVLPSNIHVNRGYRWLRGWDHEGLKTPPPYIADITEECSKGLARVVRGLRYEKQFFDIRVLTINPRAPDTVLKKDFQNWLKEQRKRSPLPTKRRGRPSVNVEITSDHTRSWAEYNILAVLDLDFYADVFGIEDLTDEQLGDLLERSLKVDPKAWGSNARAKAAEAMECVDMLTAQIKAKTSAREGGPK
jgi:hypothetical protein